MLHIGKQRLKISQAKMNETFAKLRSTQIAILKGFAYLKGQYESVL